MPLYWPYFPLPCVTTALLIRFFLPEPVGLVLFHLGLCFGMFQLFLVGKHIDKSCDTSCERYAMEEKLPSSF